MKINLMPKSLQAAAMMLFVFVLQPSLLRAAGPLTPPGAPAPTMKSLQEIEPRTLIASLPITITNSGSYYLSNNLSVSTGNGITISTNGVTLDLNGFTISSTAASATGYGIYVSGANWGISIINGAIASGVKDNGNGTFTGSGFTYGIYAWGAMGVTVSHVSASGCSVGGIYLNLTGATIAEKCTVVTSGQFGVAANAVDSCVAIDCGEAGVYGEDAVNSYGQGVYGGMGLLAYNAINCFGTSSNQVGLVCNTGQNCIGNSINGVGLNAVEATSCTGSSTTTNSEGISCYEANNCDGSGGYAGIESSYTTIGCYGYSGYGYGIYTTVANNCYGYSYISAGSTNTYAGIYASSAENCYGYSYNNNSGSLHNYGIQADVVHNCEGFGYYGAGIYAFNPSNPGAGVVENSYGQSYNSYGVYAAIANDCSGYSTNNSGLIALTVANNCLGQSVNGTGLDADSANNCYGFTQNGGYGINASSAVDNCIGECTSSLTGCYGIYAYISANNSYGYSTSPSGAGLWCSYIAIASVGEDDSSGAYGLYAYIGNSSAGIATATEEHVSYKYNMP